MLLLTTDFIPDYKIKSILGLVHGSTIHSKHIGKDILSGLQHLAGGELTGYSQMLDEAYSVALKRLEENAAQKGAHAVIGIRFATSSIIEGAAEFIAYGTAVTLVSTKNDFTNK